MPMALRLPVVIASSVLIFACPLLSYSASRYAQPSLASQPEPASYVAPTPTLVVQVKGSLSVSTSQPFTNLAADIANTVLLQADAVGQFYEQQHYQPAWFAQGIAKPEVGQLLTQLEIAELDGLHPEDYHQKHLVEGLQQLRETPDENLEWHLDILLTDAFLALAEDLAVGKVDPHRLDDQWLATRPKIDLVPLLQRALSQGHMAAALDALRPAQSGYARLRMARQHYVLWEDAVNWQALPAGPAIKPGMRDSRVPNIRQRLVALGDLQAAARQQGADYDVAMQAALRHFQQRHGLDDDAVIGKATLRELNVTPQQRLQQIDANLERWRWLPADLGKRYVLVNIAAFNLQAVADNRQALAMKVVVGRDYRRTPVFSDRIRYLEINPSWTVPTKLAVEDKLPEIRRDPGYLQRLGFRVFRGWKPDRQELEPSKIDWSQYDSHNFPFVLVQDPGPLNALGRIKFMFPNRFDVYLHDTPSRELFYRAERAFSSGCIRVQHPLQLATWLLDDEAHWSTEQIAALIDAGQTTRVPLPQPVPIHLEYWTAWVDADGTQEFRHDLYGRDQLLIAALQQPRH